MFGYRIIIGAYYPSNPIQDSLARHQRIDFVIRNEEPYYLGQEKHISGEARTIILRLLFDACGNFYEKIDRMPVIVTKAE